MCNIKSLGAPNFFILFVSPGPSRYTEVNDVMDKRNSATMSKKKDPIVEYNLV